MGNVRSGRDIDAALRRKGFHRELIGKHIHYYFSGSSLVVTHISHGMMGTTIGPPLISQMARQLHLTKAQFLDLVDCPLNETAYRDILRGRGFTI